MPALTPDQARVTAKRVLRKVGSSRNPLIRRSYRLARRTARGAINAVTGRQIGWMASVRSARWVDATTFEIGGWAYERGYAYPDGPPQIEVWLESGTTRIHATVESRVDTEANAYANKAEFDYANTGFVARLDLSRLLAHEAPDGWVTKVSVSNGRRTSSGRFKYRYRGGSARHLFAHTVEDDVQIIPLWGPSGLRFTCSRAVVMATEVTVEGRSFRATAHSSLPLTAATLSTGDRELPLSCDLADDGSRSFYVIGGVLPQEYPQLPGAAPSVVWSVAVQDTAGETHPLRTRIDDTIPSPARDASILLSSTAGQLRLNDAPAHAIVESCRYEEEPHLGLRLSGRLIGDPGPAPYLYLVGPRQELSVEASFAPDGTFEAFAPLLVSVWGQQALPPRVGGYVLRAATADGQEIRVSTTPAVTADTPQMHAASNFRIRLQSGPLQQLRFRVAVPRRADELGSYHQSRLWRAYVNNTWTPRNAVYFESFYGRSATCNPRALDGEVARSYPQLTRFWGIDDASIPVPEGAIPVIRGTREWWEARATSRYVVANDWLRRQFRPKPFQVVLQTWHGSMLKRIGLDRPNVPASKQRVILRERSKWDLLLSQNGHSTEILASAYDWDRPIMEEGYPRNDALSTSQAGPQVRERLGIPPDKTVVLYAPTWRENQTSMVAFLDLEALTRDLGEDYVLLLRGHSRTVAYGESVALAGLIDVTTYPDITELFLASDVMITDYSSVMFDFSVTRRPMIFFVPDMDDYRDSIRGVYFDLSEIAPGPVLYTQDEVLTAIRELDANTDRYAGLYRAWVERFNEHDDGHSAERVVEQLLAVRK